MTLPPFIKSSTMIDANDPNIGCDIIELFRENSDASNDRTTCSQISSSVELEKGNIDVCSMCDCTECQQLEQENSTEIPEAKETLLRGQGQDAEQMEHLDHCKRDVGGETATSASNTFTLIGHEKAPILVDLTNEETILKQFDAGGGSEIGEKAEGITECIINNKNRHV